VNPDNTLTSKLADAAEAKANNALSERVSEADNRWNYGSDPYGDIVAMRERLRDNGDNPELPYVVLYPNDVQKLIARGVKPESFEDEEWMEAHRVKLCPELAAGMAELKRVKQRLVEEPLPEEEITARLSAAMVEGRTSSPEEALEGMLIDAMRQLGRSPSTKRVCDKAGIVVDEKEDIPEKKIYSRLTLVTAFNRLIQRGLVRVSPRAENEVTLVERETHKIPRQILFVETESAAVPQEIYDKLDGRLAINPLHSVDPVLDGSKMPSRSERRGKSLTPRGHRRYQK
jgi:hypothetical protein